MTTCEKIELNIYMISYVRHDIYFRPEHFDLPYQTFSFLKSSLSQVKRTYLGYMSDWTLTHSSPNDTAVEFLRANAISSQQWVIWMHPIKMQVKPSWTDIHTYCTEIVNLTQLTAEAEKDAFHMGKIYSKLLFCCLFAGRVIFYIKNMF